MNTWYFTHGFYHGKSHTSGAEQDNTRHNQKKQPFIEQVLSVVARDLGRVDEGQYSVQHLQDWGHTAFFTSSGSSSGSEIFSEFCSARDSRWAATD